MVSIANKSSFSNVNANDHSHILTDELGSKDNLLRSPLVSSADLCPPSQLQRSFPGTPFIILYLLLVLVFEVMIFVCADILHLKLFGGVQAPFAFLTSLHVALWVITFVYDRYLHFHHHSLRKFGYLNLFLKTKEVRRVPVVVFSIGNAALLVIVALTASRADEDFSLIRVFQIVASIEVVITMVTEAVYLNVILKFNRQHKLPDVYNNDTSGVFDVGVGVGGSGGHNNRAPTPEVGFGGVDGVDDVLDKQSEMILYLQQHNRNLSRRIIELTQTLPREEQNNMLKNANVNPNMYLPNSS